ncbi:MAG: hypothetical protein NZZ60_05480 [Bacteroidia bacterium]|nr:hypothetical protein [Bacteroidia bacterium]
MTPVHMGFPMKPHCIWKMLGIVTSMVVGLSSSSLRAQTHQKPPLKYHVECRKGDEKLFESDCEDAVVLDELLTTCVKELRGTAYASAVRDDKEQFEPKKGAPKPFPPIEPDSLDEYLPELGREDNTLEVSPNPTSGELSVYLKSPSAYEVLIIGVKNDFNFRASVKVGETLKVTLPTPGLYLVVALNDTGVWNRLVVHH